MNALTVRDAYRLWAPTYSQETAISHLEARLVDAMTMPLAGLRLLDAGCGTGRRLRNSGAASAIGVDLCAEMLRAGIGGQEAVPELRTIVADVRALPLSDRAFDVVWCRLVIGHLPDCKSAYMELGRVADVGGQVIVSDFHPVAYAAGHRRSFRCDGAVHEVEHHVHDLGTHLAAAQSAGLIPVEILEADIGPDVRSFYERAGRGALYEQHLGLPVVLAIAFRREG